MSALVKARAGHAVGLSAARGVGSGNAPSLLQIDGADFIPTLFESLRDDAGRMRLRGALASTRVNQTLKLFQPVQRRFHVALIDLFCDQPGTPRLDARRVDSAGLVVRRLRSDGTLEGWMRAGARLRGWVPVDRLGDDTADVEPQRRLAGKTTGSTELDRALAPYFAARDDALFTEDSSPLHPTPPDVAGASGRSTWFGLVPTTSSEQTPESTSEALADLAADSAAFQSHLVAPLDGSALYFPLPGRVLNLGWITAIDAAGTDGPQTDDPPAGADGAVWQALADVSTRNALRRFLLLLRQLSFEFDAFGTSAESRALYAELDAIRLTLPLRSGQLVPDTVGAASFYAAAAKQLIRREPGAPGATMPQFSPALEPAATSRLAQKLSGALSRQFTSLNLMRGRYDVPDARYRVRAFVRLKPEGGCPARTLWSDYSEPFTIARWYESAGAPPARIELPGLDGLRSLKPNVAFAVPPPLQNLLQGSAKDLADGKGSTGGGVELGWICSFSLPSITICAFIVLNIFLSLFDLIFGWMAFIKICVPYPKPKPAPNP